MRFLVDEDMPRSTAPALRRAGHDAIDVRDVGLGGHSDAEIFAHALASSRAIVTADLGFANIVAFPLGSHFGIVVVRVPNAIATSVINALLTDAVNAIDGDELHGSLIIVEPGRVRLRRAQ